MNANAKEVALSEDKFIRSRLGDSESAIKKYCELVIGEHSYWHLLKYELITSFFGWIPGALGLALRKILYPLLFNNIGKGVVFGRNITLRNASRMLIGDRVVIDDDALIDARGAPCGEFVIETDALIGRGAVLQSKTGTLHVGARTSVGSFSTIISQGGVKIANDVCIGGGSKISGGLFRINDNNQEQFFDRYSKGPIIIDERSILGMGCIIIDNVHIGSRTLVGSGVTIMNDIPEDSIVGPRPPLTLKRKSSGSE